MHSQWQQSEKTWYRKWIISVLHKNWSDMTTDDAEKFNKQNISLDCTLHSNFKVVELSAEE